MNGHGGMRSPDRAWTEQEDETLRRMWCERGEFASAIARELPGRTRSSVMSRIARTIGKGKQGKPEVAEGEPAQVFRPVEFLSAAELLSRLDAGPHGTGGPVRQPKRPKSELPEVRAKRAAEGAALIAKVEAEAGPQLVSNRRPQPRPPAHEIDAYAHLRSPDAYRAAMAALSRPARAAETT